MRWIEVDTRTRTDPKIDKLLRRFGNKGFGVLVSLWLHTAAHGARPGIAIDTDGEPFDLDYLADAVDSKPAFVRRLLDLAAEVGHIDRDLWQTGLLKFPALAKRAHKYHEKKTGGDRKEAFRARRFERIAIRDGRRCVHCRAEEHLELERRIPKGEGGSSTRDENLQLACLPCARRRRLARQAAAALVKHSNAVDTQNRKSDQAGRQEAAQEGTEPDVLYVRTDRILRTDRTDQLERTHTQEVVALTRESTPRPEPGTLPLLGVTPPPKPAKATRNPHTAHAWCGRKCVPHFLHSELLAAIGGPEATAGERLIAFYREAMAGIPGDRAIPDPPLVFWRRAFAERFAGAEAVRSTLQSVTGARPQEIHRSRPPSTAAERQKLQIARTIARARR
jgi:hypothetical protein